MKEILTEAAIMRFQNAIGPYELMSLSGIAGATKELIDEGHFEATTDDEPRASYESIGKRFVEWVKEVDRSGN